MYILGCTAFDEEKSARHENKCCVGDCHETKQLINVTPYASDATLENRTIDWTLGIQGLVCCGRYEFVRSLSREWWVRKLAVIDNWNEDKVRAALKYGSWHRVYNDTKYAQKSTIQSKTKRNINCPNCGSKWNEVACDDCGFSG